MINKQVLFRLSTIYILLKPLKEEATYNPWILSYLGLPKEFIFVEIFLY